MTDESRAIPWKVEKHLFYILKIPTKYNSFHPILILLQAADYPLAFLPKSGKFDT